MSQPESPGSDAPAASAGDWVPAAGLPAAGPPASGKTAAGPPAAGKLGAGKPGAAAELSVEPETKPMAALSAEALAALSAKPPAGSEPKPPAKSEAKPPAVPKGAERSAAPARGKRTVTRPSSGLPGRLTALRARIPIQIVRLPDAPAPAKAKAGVLDAEAAASKAEQAKAERAKRAAKSAAWADAASRGFARMTVAPVILIVAWLITGLPLLLTGYFQPVPMLLIAAPLATAIAVNALHRLPDRWAVVLPGPSRRRNWTAWWALLGTIAVALGFIAWQLIMNSPSVIVTRPPGAYLQAGFWLAQHGSLPISQSAAAFGGEAGLHLSSIGFAQHGQAVVPTMMAGLPMLLAAGFWTSGVSGGMAVAPVLGGLAVLCFGGLAGRLVGRQWAPAAAAVLALSLPQLYVSRDAFTEPVVEVLLFGGLCLLIDALTLGRSRRAVRHRQPRTRLAGGVTVAVAVGGGGTAEAAGAAGASGSIGAAGADAVGGPADSVGSAGAGDADEAAGSVNGTAGSVKETAGSVKVGHAKGPKVPAVIGWLDGIKWQELPGQAAAWATPPRILGLLGGLSLGLATLTSPSALVYLLPLMAVAGVLVMARRAPGVAFCVGIFLGAGCGLAAAAVLAMPLLGLLAPALEAAAAAGAALGAFVVGLIWLLLSPRLLATVRKYLARRPLRWLPELGGLLVLAALAGLAARPYLQTVRAGPGFAAASYIGALQAAEHLPVDPTRLYAEDTLYWVIWYAGVATVLLGGFGAAVLVRRCLRALLTWRDPTGAGLNWALPLAVLLGGSAAVLWQPYTIPDQPWAARRLVPVVLPGLTLFAVWSAAWLTGKARERQAGRLTALVVGVCLVLAMAYPLVATSFRVQAGHSGTGGGLRLNSAGLALHRERGGQLGAVRGLCASIGRSSSVLILDQHTAQMFSQVIRGMCGVPVAWLSHGASVTAVDSVLRGIAKAGRRPVVLGAAPGEVAGYGGRPQLVLQLDTTDDPHQLTEPPGAPQPVRYMVWMAQSVQSNIGV